MINSPAAPTVDDPVLAKIDAALEEARREARMDDPIAQKLLDAAGVLLSVGSAKRDLARLSREAGLPGNAARHVFADWAAVMRARRHRGVLPYLAIMKEAVSGAPQDERVARVIETFGRVMASPLGVTASRRSFTEWAAACDDPELRSNFEQTEAMWHGLLEALIQGEIADGIPPFTPHNVNLILSACVDGVLVATGLTPEHSDPEAVVSTSLALWDLVKAHCAERRTH